MGLRALLGVWKADANRGGVVDVSIERFVRLLRTTGFQIDKLDATDAEGLSVSARQQLADALELDRNLMLIFYGMVSRCMVNFPWVRGRLVVLGGVKLFFFSGAFVAKYDDLQMLNEADRDEGVYFQKNCKSGKRELRGGVSEGVGART